MAWRGGRSKKEHKRLDRAAVRNAGIKSVTRIGDALAPATIAQAVYSGHRYARELDEEIDPDVVPFERELTELSPEPGWDTFW